MNDKLEHFITFLSLAVYGKQCYFRSLILFSPVDEIGNTEEKSDVIKTNKLCCELLLYYSISDMTVK